MTFKNEKIQIGGIYQSILTMYTDIGNPLLLILHGGPGSPDRPLVKKYNAELAKSFNVISWDQRCSGLSYTKESLNKPLTTELMFSDLEELVDYLLCTYNQDKLYLSGHSWGAYLGLWYSSVHPEKLHYYIGTGQGISSSIDEIEKYNFVLSKATQLNDKKSLDKLLSFGVPKNGIYKSSSKTAVSFVGKLIHKYGGYIHPDNNFSTNKYITDYLFHYKKDVMKVIGGINYSVKNLIPEMKKNDILPEIKRIDVPIKLIFGEDDYICPVLTAKNWFNSLSAPKKDFVVIKKAAHMVNFEQPEKWNSEVLSCII